MERQGWHSGRAEPLVGLCPHRQYQTHRAAIQPVGDIERRMSAGCKHRGYSCRSVRRSDFRLVITFMSSPFNFAVLNAASEDRARRDGGKLRHLFRMPNGEGGSCQRWCHCRRAGRFVRARARAPYMSERGPCQAGLSVRPYRSESGSTEIWNISQD